jgi:hypothetical protein
VIGWKLKAGLSLPALLALGFLLWRVNVWRDGYLERDKAVADLAAYGAAVEARDEQAAKDRAEDESRRERLSLKLEGVSAELADLKSNPITRVVTREKIVNGVSCPDPRIGPDWFRVRNAAQAIADSAVSGAD